LKSARPGSLPDRSDEHWESAPKRDAFVKEKPSELVRDAKIYFSLEAGETLLPEAVKYLGAEHFLYASDIPHWDNEFPGNLHALRNHPAVSDSDKEKILYKNAKELFAL
jgi:predicted TIM-barrel fold metal-dependent hydrolase